MKHVSRGTWLGLPLLWAPACHPCLGFLASRFPCFKLHLQSKVHLPLPARTAAGQRGNCAIFFLSAQGRKYNHVEEENFSEQATYVLIQISTSIKQMANFCCFESGKFFQGWHGKGTNKELPLPWLATVVATMINVNIAPVSSPYSPLCHHLLTLECVCL